MAKCKFCKQPIEWIKDLKKWRLLNTDGTPHKCPAKEPGWYKTYDELQYSRPNTVKWKR